MFTRSLFYLFLMNRTLLGEECVFDYMPDLTPEDEACHYKMYFNECG